MPTRLREFRKLRGMTLQSLAQKVGTTAQTIQRLETENMTVSLDWLERIADVFGMPVAALLVDEKTASVPVLGDLDKAGVLLPPDPLAPVTSLSLVISAHDPVAVRVSEPLLSFEPERRFEAGTLLIGGRMELDRSAELEAKGTLISHADGRVRFCRLGAEQGALSILHVAGDEQSAVDGSDIRWVAPLVMAVRYF